MTISIMTCVILGTILAGVAYLLGRRSLDAERRRADESEQRARAYREMLEAFSRQIASRPDSRESGPLPEGRLDRSAPAPRSTPPTEGRYLFVSFEEEIRRVRERGAPLTLLTLSVGPLADRSEPVGRSSGDRLLRAVTHAVRGQMRGCDTCVRYAGDEFLLILPGVSPDEARRVEDRIRVAVHGIALELRPGSTLRPRASLGAATYPDDGVSFDQLFTAAEGRRQRERSGPRLATRDPGLPAGFPVPPGPVSRN